MIDVREIETEIAKLENGDTTYKALEKLSVLYAVKNNLHNQDGYSYASEPVKEIRTETASEFLQACYNSDMSHVLSVMDEHMKAIQVLYPKEYKKIINGIRNTKTVL